MLIRKFPNDGIFQPIVIFSPCHLPGSRPSVNFIGRAFIGIILPDRGVRESLKEMGVPVEIEENILMVYLYKDECSHFGKALLVPAM